MAVQVLALLEHKELAQEVTVCLWVYDVSVVASFRQAIDLLNERQFDLIISDVHLENGGTVYDFLRWAKSDPLLNSIPFVLVSANATSLAKYLSDGVRTSARLLGAAKYIDMSLFDPVFFRTEIDEVLHY